MMASKAWRKGSSEKFAPDTLNAMTEGGCVKTPRLGDSGEKHRTMFVPIGLLALAATLEAEGISQKNPVPRTRDGMI